MDACFATMSPVVKDWSLAATREAAMAAFAKSWRREQRKPRGKAGAFKVANDSI
jgi:hypothetical protein